MPSPARLKARPVIKEFGLIRSLRREFGGGHASVVCGIGDDAAVIEPTPGLQLVLTTDLLAEGIHFHLRTASFEDVGYKAAIANLSDVAAMGGTPQYVLIALAIPRGGTRTMVQHLYRGMMAACRPHGVRLIGGDTSASHGGWFVGVVLIGSTAAHRALLRSGARAGDDLYVTGTLGDSLAGFKLLQSPRISATLPAGQRRFLVQRHLRPTARVREGHWLSSGRWASSAIDVSDGLSGDLRHICEESRVGVEIDLSALPISNACRTYAAVTKQDATDLALAGGEDYELLFTVPRRQRKRFLLDAARHRIRVTRIGTIKPARSGIRGMAPGGRLRALTVTSYEHFHNP